MTCKCGRDAGTYKNCPICRAINTERRRQHARGNRRPDPVAQTETLTQWAPAPWMDRANCRGTNLAKFFPARGTPHQFDELRRICGACPVRGECLEDCLVYETDPSRAHGFRAGLTVDERRDLQKRRREVA